MFIGYLNILFSQSTWNFQVFFGQFLYVFWLLEIPDVV